MYVNKAGLYGKQGVKQLYSWKGEIAEISVKLSRLEPKWKAEMSYYSPHLQPGLLGKHSIKRCLFEVFLLQGKLIVYVKVHTYSYTHYYPC